MADDLECPTDGRRLESTMIEFPGAQAQVYHCDACLGEYMEGDEVERVLGRRDIDLSAPPPGRVRGPTRKCPRCDKRMYHKYARGAVVDQCFHCRSLWLDSQEYETLMHPGDRPVSTRMGRYNLETTPKVRGSPDDDERRARTRRDRRIFAFVRLLSKWSD